MKQGFNPYLPLNEYVPDAEPHVFGDRVYIYGSHDKEDGDTFCMLDYVSYSASCDDLTSWRYEGVIYRASQDPDYRKKDSLYSPVVREYMYAPDVVRGNDERYYLYYCMSGRYGQGGYHGPIRVAVCDKPAGHYEYLGYVQHADGTAMLEGVCFDPAVLNDEGIIRLYYGTQYLSEEAEDFLTDEQAIRNEMDMFNKTREEIVSHAGTTSVMGAYMAVLENDMLTVKGIPYPVIPYKVKGTSFEGHSFYEGSSIRKIGRKYYFIYSSCLNHELCYAVSEYADHGYVYGGTIVSNGDVGLNGRTEAQRLNMTGTTHGSIEKIKDQWYVFYHRLTHKSDYSRQGCAEPIEIRPDGTIAQVPVSSCGLNGKPLPAQGNYPAAICCVLSNGAMPHGSNHKLNEHFPHIGSKRDQRYVRQLQDGTLIGFRYFTFTGECLFSVTMQCDMEAEIEIYQGLPKGFAAEQERETACIAKIEIPASKTWILRKQTVPFAKGDYPLYLLYRSKGEGSMLEIAF